MDDSLENLFDCSLDEMVDNFINNEDALLKTIEDGLEGGKNIELDLQIEQMIERKESKQWQCKVCGKTAKYKSFIKAHAETHIDVVKHACHICKKTLSNRDSLRKHIGDYHSSLKSNCKLCDKKDMSKMSFQWHKRTCKV